MNESEMKAELERLRAENAKLKTKDKGGITLKVSEKGAVSLYGMGRFPVTLYKEQWLRLLASDFRRRGRAVRCGGRGAFGSILSDCGGFGRDRRRLWRRLFEPANQRHIGDPGIGIRRRAGVLRHTTLGTPGGEIFLDRAGRRPARADRRADLAGIRQDAGRGCHSRCCLRLLRSRNGLRGESSLACEVPAGPGRQRGTRAAQCGEPSQLLKILKLLGKSRLTPNDGRIGRKSR